jgi:hypothetical protein
VVIALIITLPVSIALTGFLVLKSVQLGLKWQIQTSEKEKPEMKIPNPIKEQKEQKQTVKQVAFTADILDEYLNGPKESR